MRLMPLLPVLLSLGKTITNPLIIQQGDMPQNSPIRELPAWFPRKCMVKYRHRT
jgi:hypothetical protein